jgi:F0F1-type ATP synthase assembly protein I
MDSPQDPIQDRKKLKQPYNSYLKYSSLGLQLLLTIGIAGWLGYKLDQLLKIKYPVFMIVFGLMAFAGMMYQLYRSINR